MKWHFLAALLCTAFLSPAVTAQDLFGRVDRLETSVAAIRSDMAEIKALLKAKNAAICPVLGTPTCPGGCECQAGGVCTCLTAKATLLLRFTCEDTRGQLHEVYATDAADAIRRVNAKLAATYVVPSQQAYLPMFAPQFSAGCAGGSCR